MGAWDHQIDRWIDQVCATIRIPSLQILEQAWQNSTAVAEGWIKHGKGSGKGLFTEFQGRILGYAGFRFLDVRIVIVRMQTLEE